MKRKNMLVLATIGILVGGYLLYILVTFVIGFTTLTKDIKESKSYSGSNQDIIEYVKDTYDVDVKIIKNLGPKNIHNGGGATVQTTDERELTFDIDISVFDNIKGDTYEKMNAIYVINESLKSSGDIKKLENIGVYDLAIQLPWSNPTDYSLTPRFHFSLAGDEALSSKHTVDVLHKSLSYAEKWKNEAINELDLEIDKIEMLTVDNEGEFQLVTLSIQDELQESLEELESRLLRENLDVFSQHFINDKAKEIEHLEEQLGNLEFHENRQGNFLSCNEMKILDECEHYTVHLKYPSDTTVQIKEEFRYDDPQVKEMLFDAIQVINSSDLPINQLHIQNLYRPSDLEDQQFTEKELREKSAERVHFRTEATLINNLPEISKIEDIVFEE